MGRVQQATSLLIQSGVLRPAQFNKVEIRWCPLSGAHGMAPDRGKVLFRYPLPEFEHFEGQRPLARYNTVTSTGIVESPPCAEP